MNSPKNTTKQFLMMLTLCAAIVMGIFLIQSCEPEDALTADRAGTSDNEIYALSNSASIIDLADAAGVSENEEVSITIEPKFGSLRKLSGTLYRYEPADFSGKDQFSIGIAGRSAAHDPIHITVYDDSTALPCDQIHAFEDSVNTPVNTKVNIRFLDNDRLCDVKKKDLKKSIYQKPRHGKATIIGDEIVYTPNRGFEGADDLIYLISAKGKGKSYGLVSIMVGLPVDTCTVFTNDDFFTASSSGYSFLPVLRNDNLCGGDSLIIIDGGPRHGLAFNDFNGGEIGIGYLPDSSSVFLGDTIRYRVCSPISFSCDDAEVVIFPSAPSDSSAVARQFR
jgi:hypothetical protein